MSHQEIGQMRAYQFELANKANKKSQKEAKQRP
jgi:hypothetical protein